MTRLIVLGLLERQPMSGYDIQQMISEGMLNDGAAYWWDPFTTR